MVKVEKTITINAPVEKVFAHWTEPENLPEIWPSLVEVKDSRKLPNGGNFFRWVYKMVGMRFEGTAEDIEWVRNQRTVTVDKGGIDCTITWTFQPEGEGTKLITVFEYTVPIPLLGRLAEPFILKVNERELESLLVNLKTKLEV